MRFLSPVLVLLGCAILLPAQLTPANFDIRFEPNAKLQTQAPIPFRITINDDRSKPVVQAKVTLLIERPDHTQNVTYKAPMISPGVYLAKAVFPGSGQWNVTVQVEQSNRESARTSTYTVPD